MATVRRTLVLTGGRAGATCVLAKYRFVDGRLTLEGSPTTVDKLTMFLGRTYKAFPEGSRELEEATNGLHSEIRAEVGGGGPAPLSSGDRPRERGAPSVPAPDVGPGDAAPTRGTTQLPARDGHAQPGLHGGSVRIEAVRAGVARLDPRNDEHWAVDGKPALAIVSVLAGLSDLTRAELDAAGVRRPAI